MSVVIDVLHTVAVVAIALGAVAELHIGIVRVGQTADGTFVEISLPLFYILLCLLEVDSLGGGPVADSLAASA